MVNCCRSISAYKGPLVFVGIGVGFMVIGAIPVAVTFCIDAISSATIIGVGFIGFGLLLLLPGLVWCIVRRTTSCCAKGRLRCSEAEKEKTNSLRTKKYLLDAEDGQSHITPEDHYVEGSASLEKQSVDTKVKIGEEEDLNEDDDDHCADVEARLTR